MTKLYTSIVVSLFLCFTFNSINASTNPAEFNVSGRVEPKYDAPTSFYLENPDESQRGKLYVLLSEGNVKTVKKILKGGRFDFVLPWDLAEVEITLRVIYPEGYVSLEDKRFTPMTKFLPGRDMKSIEEIIVLSTVEDRFNAEKDIVIDDLQSKECVSDVFERIDTMHNDFFKSQSLFLFTVAKLWADALHHAGEFRCPVQDWEIARIFKYQRSEDPSFSKLSTARQFNLFAQHARSLHKLESPSRELISGPISEWIEGTSFSLQSLTVADVAVHCYRQALNLRTKNENRTGYAWRLVNGLVDMLYSVEKYDEVMTEIYDYFTSNEFPRVSLTDAQKKGVVRLLSTYKDSLANSTGRLSWREESYIQHVVATPSILEKWEKFGELLQKWNYLYPPNSPFKSGKSLHSHLELFMDIQQEKSKAINGDE